MASGSLTLKTNKATRMTLHRSKDKLLASHDKLSCSSPDTSATEHSISHSTEKTSKSYNCLAIKHPNLKDMVVSQQVCIDLCMPFWRCRPLHKTASLPPQSSVDSSERSSFDPSSKPSSNGTIKPSRLTVRMSRDSLVPHSKDDLFCVKTPYPIRVNPDAMTLDSASLTSDLGTVSRSFSKSQLTSQSSSALDGDIISLDTRSCSEASLRYHGNFHMRFNNVQTMLDDHINRALYVSNALKKGSSASSSSQRNKQNKEQKSGVGLIVKPGSPSGMPELDKGQILPTDRGELPPPPRTLSDANQDLAGSRQSFRMAMGNPYADETLTDMGDL